jgi:hypothetical protein
MQDEYPADEGVRLYRVCDSRQAEGETGRLFVCASCRVQVIICGCCDRGQVYCNHGCAPQARQQTLRSAGQRYQASPRGRRMHAGRTRRWRARRERVTHQGSPPSPADDLLASVAMMPACDDAFPADRPRPAGPHCHWCGRCCPALLRQGFLRRRRRHRRRVGHERTGPARHGDAT